MSLAPGGDSSGLFGTGISGSTALTGGGLALGAGGLAYLLSQGPAPLPSEFQTLTGDVPQETAEATSLEAGGQALTGQGAQALQMAQQGQLTPEQQAQLSLYHEGLSNTAEQTFASMGRNINQDTSGISAQAQIDTQVNAMAQAQIQSTIALGLGEVSAGNTMTNTGLGFQNAANSALIAAGQAQVQADTNYSNALTGVFTAIGSMVGAAGKAAVPSDAELKTDIVPIGKLGNGIGFYSFRFKWDWTPYVGVIAQEVLKTMPDAVERGDDGWLRVDYGKVGAPFMRLEDWKRSHARH